MQENLILFSWELRWDFKSLTSNLGTLYPGTSPWNTVQDNTGSKITHLHTLQFLGKYLDKTFFELRT